MHYTAVFPNDADQEWFIMTHQDLLIQQYRNSELKVSGHPKKLACIHLHCISGKDMAFFGQSLMAARSPEELPREQVLAPPELPSLKQLVYGKANVTLP